MSLKSFSLTPGNGLGSGADGILMRWQGVP